MASLDQMEGDAVELVLVIVLCILAFAIFAGGSVAGNVANSWRKIWLGIDGFFARIQTSLNAYANPKDVVNAKLAQVFGSDSTSTGSDFGLVDYQNVGDQLSGEGS